MCAIYVCMLSYVCMLYDELYNYSTFHCVIYDLMLQSAARIVAFTQQQKLLCRTIDMKPCANFIL